MAGWDIDNLEQDCSNSIANAMELQQSCTKPLIGGIFHEKIQNILNVLP